MTYLDVCIKKLIGTLCCLIFTNSLIANNLQIGTPAISGTQLSFTIQWDNSWRLMASPANWDAVWIFVKYQDCNNLNAWYHADLQASGHSVSGGVLEVQTVLDNKGVFIRRAAAGFGNIASSTVTLNLTALAASATNNYQVFGVEMVQVPSGDFQIGDGTAAADDWRFCDAPATTPKTITSLLESGGMTASEYTNNANFQVALPAAFPLGWTQFYVMKYEITQYQYVGFLNSLSYDQQSYRTANPPSSAVGTLAIASSANARNGIRTKVAGIQNSTPAVYACDLNNNGIFDQADDGQNLACNWLTWADITAYLDWAALRPMTEFEYEKACRGTSTPVANEYAWGTTHLTQATSAALTDSGLANEASSVVQPAMGLAAYGANDANQGVLRAAFAASSQTNRIQAGASFYGVMNLSDNVLEHVVVVNSQYPAAANFTTTDGDGSLNAFGEANVSGWATTGGASGGSGFRGSDWFSTNPDYLEVSSRIYAWNTAPATTPTVRDAKAGGRGVRSW